MRLWRVRFTIQRLMAAIVGCALVFTAIASHRERLLRSPELKGLEMSYENAKLTRVVAEIGVEEYDEDAYKRAEAVARDEIARADRIRAEDRLVWSNKMLQKGSAVMQHVPFEPRSPQAFFTEGTACPQRIRSKYTRNRTLESLKNEVKAALADEQSKKAAYDRMKALMIWSF